MDMRVTISTPLEENIDVDGEYKGVIDFI